MSAKYRIGDRVRILGFVEPCDFMYYNDDEDMENNMDTFIGCVGDIIAINDRGNDKFSYIVRGCGDWQWVDEWIRLEGDDDVLPAVVSAEDFEMVVV